jgi:diguanylate cyclase (GGDEF)-like protein
MLSIKKIKTTMQSGLRRWFASPGIAGNEEDQHRVILMNGMINAGIIFVLLIFCANLFDRSTPLRNYLIDLLLLAAFLITRLALHKGKVVFAGIGALTLGFVLTIASIVSDGTVRSTAVSLLLLVIIIAGILYKIKGIFVSIIASSLAVLLLIMAQNAGLLHRSDYSVSLLHWFVLTVTFIIVGGIVYFSDHITMKAFSNAREELRERRRAENELKIANEELQKRMMEVEKLQVELRAQALHDPLTGLPNRRYLDEILSREVLRANRNNDCMGIIIADIDHFKTINDTYGHHVGDLFLVEISRLLERELRGSDFVCRYGGEEFVLVLLGANVDSTEKRAEEIRKKCAQIIVQHEENNLSITLSFGVAIYPLHGEQWEEIIKKADHALYDAKRMGRNQVRVWERRPF